MPRGWQGEVTEAPWVLSAGRGSRAALGSAGASMAVAMPDSRGRARRVVGPVVGPSLAVEATA